MYELLSFRGVKISSWFLNGAISHSLTFSV